jgi:hypothetical protein
MVERSQRQNAQYLVAADKFRSHGIDGAIPACGNDNRAFGLRCAPREIKDFGAASRQLDLRSQAFGSKYFGQPLMDFSVVGFSRSGVDDNNYVRRHSAKTTNRVLIAGKNGWCESFRTLSALDFLGGEIQY